MSETTLKMARRKAWNGSTPKVDGFGITARCRQYLSPLIKGESYPPYRNGLPQYVTPKNVAVPKKLRKKFAI